MTPTASPVLVDTDVFSFVYKGDTRAALYAPHLNGRVLHLAFATVGELHRWAVQHSWGPAHVGRLRATISRYTVIHSDDATPRHWAEAMSIKGKPIGQGDAWVAAVAITHGMPLVTHNRKDFDGIPGLTVISEG